MFRHYVTMSPAPGGENHRGRGAEGAWLVRSQITRSIRLNQMLKQMFQKHSVHILVGGLEHVFYFFHVSGIIISTD